MDVDANHFRKSLLPILRDICAAKIVTFDLEMSGISTKPSVRAYDAGKPTLQQQYDEMKSAAETYQVLQMGITCVLEDRDKGMQFPKVPKVPGHGKRKIQADIIDAEFYMAKPYNFNLSPLLLEGVGNGQAGLKLSRDFTFSSSAAEFLSRNGFDFGKVFRDGVPYLSRDEEIEMLEEHKQREDRKANMSDVIIATEDHKTLNFVRSARQTVNDWLLDPKDDNFVNVADPAGSLTGLQRRLVHQFIRKEFPTLRTYGLNDGRFMQVVKTDPVQELAAQNRRLAGFKINLAKQTGLRWIFEAMCGGDLSGVDSQWFTRDLDKDEATAIEEELKTIVKTLKSKKQMIVGHNLFFDLGFLYKTFIGVLPQDVKHFQEDIHELFPFVVDTKYLATHAPNHTPRSGLKELLEPFRKVRNPLVILHEEHGTYGGHHGRDHEAGYDSWMTAELFIKLSAQLYGESNDHSSSSSDSETDSPTSSESDNPTKNYQSSHCESDGGVKINFEEEDLIDFDDIALHQEDPLEIGDETHTQKWLPKMTSKFWVKYVNKLRVNSSEEGFCDLAERGPER